MPDFKGHVGTYQASISVPFDVARTTLLSWRGKQHFSASTWPDFEIKETGPGTIEIEIDSGLAERLRTANIPGLRF